MAFQTIIIIITVMVFDQSHRFRLMALETQITPDRLEQFSVLRLMGVVAGQTTAHRYRPVNEFPLEFFPLMTGKTDLRFRNHLFRLVLDQV